MSKMTILLDGQEHTLRWDLRAILELEDAGHGVERLTEELQGDTPTRAALLMGAAMINSGAVHAGEAAEMTADKLEEMMTPKKLLELRRKSAVARLAGMRRECPSDDDDEAVDVVLEQLEKKSPGNETPADTSAGD